MSIARAGVRMRGTLLGDQVRRGLIGRDLFAVAATLADAPGEDWVVLTLDHQADPKLADIVVQGQTATAVRLGIVAGIITAETANDIILEI